jgi:hypothetical protein
MESFSREPDGVLLLGPEKLYVAHRFKAPGSAGETSRNGVTPGKRNVLLIFTSAKYRSAKIQMTPEM